MADEKSKVEVIYERLNGLRDIATKDMHIDRGNLETNFNSQIKVTEWLNRRLEWQRVFNSLEAKRKEAWKNCYEYYRKDYNLKLNSAEEYRIMIETDPNYSNIMNESQAVKEVLNYIDTIVDALKARAWDVSNLAKWLMWTNGNQ